MRISVVEGQGVPVCWDGKYRVWLDGEDVSDRCQVADDVVGHVRLVKRNEEGHFYVDDDGDVAVEWRHGVVRIERAE